MSPPEGAGTPAGLLLTGGRSSRMGRDKATIRLADGRSFAERAATLLGAVAAPALEVGPGVSGLPSVLEDVPGSGPLAAVVAGWRALCRLGAPATVLVLACDLPLVAPELLASLAGWPDGTDVVPLVAGRAQWCCARYRAASLERAAALLASGRRDLAALVPPEVTWLGADEIGELAGTLTDADTPEQLAALGLALLAG